MQNYVSEELHHFVGRRFLNEPDNAYALLVKILNERRLSPNGQPVTGGVTLRIDLSEGANLTNEKMLCPCCVCFADIPIGDLGVHTSKYGRFGLSFNKVFLASRNARPVTYIPIAPGNGGPLQGGQLLRDIEAAYRGIRMFCGARNGGSRRMGQEPKSQEEAITVTQAVFETAVLPFYKVFHVALPHEHNSNFYMEREWRILHELRFEHADITRLFVSASHMNKLESTFPKFANRIVPLQ